jgi:hypothetical protein
MKYLIKYNFIWLVTIILFAQCSEKEPIATLPLVKLIDSLPGNYILHHYYRLNDFYFPGPAYTNYRHVYPNGKDNYNYLTISKDSFFFTNPGKFTKKFPADISKTTFSGKMDVPQNQECFQYSGYIDKDTLRITLNEQYYLCEFKDSMVIKHLSLDSKCTMVYYKK